MSKDAPSDLSASVKQKLLNVSRDCGEDANTVLVRYAIERFLYRLSTSSYSSEFLLKGAMLFAVWTDIRYRSTMDVDLLGCGQDSEAAVRKTMADIASTDGADGLKFDPESIRIQEIREDQLYLGWRVRMIAYLGKARIPVQIDIGFGDAVAKDHGLVEFPSLLQLPAPKLQAYSKEELIAEKFNAMVNLGVFNSRLKDYFDIWILSQDFEFRGSDLTSAITATFERRETELPSSVPAGLSEEFFGDAGKQKQWSAFLAKVSAKNRQDDLGLIVADLVEFLLLPTFAAGAGEGFDRTWHPGGPWQDEQ